MKNKINHSVVVGLFITIGVLLLVAVIFLLGGQQKKFIKTFTVKAIFNDINGLQAGNNVWLFGVKVGTIKKVSFSGSNQVEVTMHIEKDAQSRIHKDGTAKISSDGFIGSKIIVLHGGNIAVPQVEDGDYLHIAETAGTEEILATLQQNNKNLLEITGNIKTVSKKLLNGEGSLGILLSDPTMAQDIKTAIAHFKAVSVKSEALISNVQHFSEGLHKKGSLANELVTDTIVFNTVRSTVAHLNTASRNLQTASLKVTSFADSLQKASASLNDPKKPVGMILNDTEVAQNIRVMIKNLESGSKKLDDDLEAVQHNFLLRGFFRRREKAQKQEALHPTN